MKRQRNDEASNIHGKTVKLENEGVKEKVSTTCLKNIAEKVFRRPFISVLSYNSCSYALKRPYGAYLKFWQNPLVCPFQSVRDSQT